MKNPRRNTGSSRIWNTASGLLFTAIALGAAELPVKEGLFLQLDAATQPVLRKSAELPPLGNGRPVDRWRRVRPTSSASEAPSYSSLRLAAPSLPLPKQRRRYRLTSSKWSTWRFAQSAT